MPNLRAEIWRLGLPKSRSQWPHGLRRRSATAGLLRLWVRIQPSAWTFVYCECCVLSGRGLRRADHSSRGVLPTVVRRCVWSRNLVNEEALAYWGLSRQKKKKTFWRSGMNATQSRQSLSPRSKWDFCSYGLLTLRRLMSYIYGAPILDVSRSHTTTQHSR